MKRRLTQLFRSQHGVASRAQIRLIGVSRAVEARRVDAGEWDRPAPTVVRLAGSAVTPAQSLMVAMLAAGGSVVASHQSAAWLWGFGPVPERPVITVGEGRHRPEGPFVVHRLRGPAPIPVIRRGFAATNPLRTLVDLAGVVDAGEIDDSIDRAVASQLVTVEGVHAEIGRLSRQGRKGVGALREALRRRGLIEGPPPSVLESRFHRLLRAAGITPLASEVVAGPHGEYRIDTLLSPRVAVEVDGHIHHSTPEQKAHDEHRRNRIRMQGVHLIVYTWRDVVFDGRRVAAECHEALARFGPRRLAN